MIVFITGASSGFGAEMARVFVGHGHQVVITGRRRERLNELAAELGELALPIEMDVTDKASIEEALAHLPQSWRQIDVLINNAGLALGTQPAHTSALEDWETMIATNCTGLVTMTRALLPDMVARGAGLVINLGSTAGFYPYPGGNVYGATRPSSTNLRSICAPIWSVPACARPISRLACAAAPSFPMCVSRATTALPPRSTRAPSH